MMQSRTKNVARNMSFGLICQIIGLIMNFVSRTVFIKMLGSDYLGVSGLFANILTILSFAELGIGNAIIFSMYTPLAKYDTEKIKSLMLLYKKAYRIIGILVAVIGLACIPFLDVIIKNKPDIRESLVLIYLLYLLNTVVSYFYTYKKSIITADQKNFIVVLYTQVFQIAQIILQTLFLIFTRNFIIYLVLQVGFTALTNIFLSYKADKMYLYLSEDAAPLSSSETRAIFKNVKALVMYKFGSIILNGTDNIIISAMVGVTAVGLVSNYLLFINAMIALLGKILEAFTASVGNLNAVGTRKEQYRVFNKMFFINTWIYGFASVGFLLLIQPIIHWWIGSDYLLEFSVVFALILHFYINGVHNAAYTYRTTLGFFVQGRLAPICAALLNIVLSIVLCNYIGLAGIFFATCLARFLVIGIVDVYLIYKNTFQRSSLLYYAKYFGFLSLYTVLYFICKAVISMITVNGIAGILLKGVTLTLLFNGAMLLLFYKTQNFKELKASALQLLKRG